MIIAVMGVSGSGKTTIGTMLADALSCAYLEGDSLHPARNIEAMAGGIALTDADRGPWLAAIRSRIVEAYEAGRNLVVGCSALKESYRRILDKGLPITWIYLKGPPELIRSRMLERADHFMAAGMLDSQIEALEEPHDAIVVDIALPPHAIVENILMRLKPEVRIFPTLDELSVHAAETAAATMRDVVNTGGRCSLVLSGGSTPSGLYQLLGSRFREAVPWKDVHVFWSDERYVPHDDERSNYRMAREALLDHVPCPPANVHPMPTQYADPADAARAYEAMLHRYFATGAPVFDLSILGLGADGHTASLFPGEPALLEQTRWVLAVAADAEPPSRLTLTLPLLTASARTWFVVAGSSKAPAVRTVLSGSADPRNSPAASIQHARGTVIWWLDVEAAD